MFFVNIIKLCKNFNNNDWFSKNDFSIKVIYNGEERTTTIKWNNTSPVWNESFVFNLNTDIKHFTIQLIENNTLSENNVIKNLLIETNYYETSKINVDEVELSFGNILYSLTKKNADLLRDFKNIESLVSERDLRIVTLSQNLSNKIQEHRALKKKLDSIETILKNNI